MNKAVMLGDEDDQALFSALREVLRAEGASLLDEQWGVVGSQEVSIWRVQLRGRRLTVEAETYMGLSLRAPAALVDEISATLAERAAA